jgi:hypothetical protein
MLVCYHAGESERPWKGGGLIVTRKIPIDVVLDPAVALVVAEGLVQVTNIAPLVPGGPACHGVTVCPGGPYEHGLVYESAAGAERAAGILRRLACLAIESYLRALSTGTEVVFLGDQGLPVECHPDTPREGPPTPDEIKQIIEQFRQPRAYTFLDNHKVKVAAPDDQTKVVGPDLFAGDLSAMGRLLDDIAAATARHALRVQDLKQVARSAAEAIEQTVKDLKLKGGLWTHAVVLRQALARLEELEDR